MIDLPGDLKPIYKIAEWKELLLKSGLSPEHKLVGTVIADSCSYNKREQLQLSAISFYSISRILNCTQTTVQNLVKDLLKYGWIYDTKKPVGARQVYALTFSLVPRGDIRK